MIKRITSVMALVMLLAALTGCAGTTVVVGNCTCPTEHVSNVTEVSTATEAPISTEAPVTAQGVLKTGLAIVASAEAKEKDGNPQVAFDVTTVAVTVDENGVIQSCIIDSLNPSVTVDATGAIVSDIAAPIATKNELGESYGMKAYAGSKYEWNEQAAAVAAYAVGKTADEFRNGAVNESGKAKDADLATTATIYIGGYVNAIVEAAQNAQELGAAAGDTLKFAAIPSLAKSTAATAEKAGTIQLDCDVVAMTMNGDTITSCYIDSLQAKVAVDNAGVLTIPEAFQTKNQLGENYGMKAWGDAVAEWNEQAASLAAYVTGKTPAQVAGIAVNEKTAPTDADLASSVTISIGGYQALIAKAAQ